MAKQLNYEEELYRAFGQVGDFTTGMRIARHFYEKGREDMLEDIEQSFDWLDIDKDQD